MLPDEVRALVASAPPVPVQPKHLPATDPTLATEIMPAPPPTSYLFPPANSHHRKPPTVLSYLPMLDPGSTYVNGISLSLSDGATITPAGDLEDHRKKKRSRSQKPLPPKQPTRSSARNSTPQTSQMSSSKPAAAAIQDMEPAPATSTRASRQVSPASAPINPMASSDTTTSRRSARKVKLTVSEPLPNPPASSSNTAEVSAQAAVLLKDHEDIPISEERATDVLNQNKILSGVDGLSAVRYKSKNKASDDDGPAREGSSDFHQYPDVCSSCVMTTYSHPSMANLPVSAYDREGGGALVYCDSCPRSFHLLCLNPPIDGQGGKEDIPEGGWYCQECSTEHDYLSTGRMPSPSPQFGTELFGPLLARLQSKNPAEFQLPEDIRHYYKYVVTGPRGGYIDGRKWKLAKGNKQLLFEDRDLYRTRDRNNRPVLCFKCSGSAVRSAISGDAQMAGLIPSSPSSKAQDLPDVPEAQSVQTGNLDLLSAVAESVTPEPVVAKVENPEDEPLLNGNTPENVASGSGVQAAKQKVTGKRKRELSPVGVVVDNNSQNGPRTRRRTENGLMAAKSAVFDLSDGGRPILSCDFCPLHWHMDCIDPPMTAIPASERRWMCPNHIEHIFAMKPRAPKHSPLPTVDVSSSGQYNSGLINIVSNDPPPPPPPPRKRKPTVKVGRIEDMWVGSKRYRVPEHVVLLDFWRKVRDPNAPITRMSDTGSSMDVDDRSDGGSSSSLTELSSSDEDGKKSGRSERGLEPGQRGLRATRGMMRGGMRESKGKKRSKPLATTAPSRSLPRRGANARKVEPVDDSKLLTPPLDDQPSHAYSLSLSPSKLAPTLNSKGGLTLRIPKPIGSPSGKGVPITLSRPNSTRAKADGQASKAPVFPSTPPLADSDKALVMGSGAGTLRTKRSNASMAAKSSVAIVTRAGLRSTRGRSSDAAPSGVDDSRDDFSFGANDADGAEGHSDLLLVTKPVQPSVTPPVLVYSNPGRYWQ